MARSDACLVIGMHPQVQTTGIPCIFRKRCSCSPLLCSDVMPSLPNFQDAYGSIYLHAQFSLKVG